MTQEKFSNLKQPRKDNRQICFADVANKFAVRNYKTGKEISGSDYQPPHF